MRRRQPQASVTEPSHELAALHHDGSRSDHGVSVLLGNVVVVALERTARDAEALSEGVELVVRFIADEMAPLSTVEPPARLVHQDRHGDILAATTSACGEGGAESRHTGRVNTADDVDDTPPSELRLAWNQHVSSDDELLDRLITRYRERQRRYHRIEHVERVVRLALELAETEEVSDLDAVVAAAMYHDAIYEPTHPANERASARLARRDLAKLDWSSARCDLVGTMIEGTATHSDPSTVDEAVLFDADLAILGADGSDYVHYVGRVRDEYSHLDDAEWTDGRITVMRSFLDREAIYATATGNDRWEAAARRNITGELETLQS